MAEMVRRKLEDYKLSQHFDNYAEIDLNIAQKNYQDVVDRIDRVRDYFHNKMSMLYTNFVRKDPFRAYYNY